MTDKTTEALNLAEEWLSFDAPSYVFQTIREALAEQAPQNLTNQ